MRDPSGGGSFFGTDEAPFDPSGLVGFLLAILIFAGVIGYLLLTIT